MPLSPFSLLTATPTVRQQIEQIQSLSKELQQLRDRSSQVLGAIAAYAGPPGPAYGPIVETFADDAARIVEGRRAQEFAAAPFDGDHIRAQAQLCHLLDGLRSLGELLVGDTAAAQAGATAQLGGTVSAVADATQYSLQSPFCKDQEQLETLAAPLLRRLDKYEGGLQKKKGVLGRFRTLLGQAEAEKQQLSEEVQSLRSGAVAPAPAPRPAAPLPAPRRARRSRRGAPR